MCLHSYKQQFTVAIFLSIKIKSQNFKNHDFARFEKKLLIFIYFSTSGSKTIAPEENCPPTLILTLILKIFLGVNFPDNFI